MRGIKLFLKCISTMALFAIFCFLSSKDAAIYYIVTICEDHTLADDIHYFYHHQVYY